MPEILSDLGQYIQDDQEHFFSRYFFFEQKTLKYSILLVWFNWICLENK